MGESGSGLESRAIRPEFGGGCGAPAAIAVGRCKAAERGVTARVQVGDALELAASDERFHTVLDCALFHVLLDEDRGAYVGTLAAVVPPGGRVHLLAMSDRQPGDWRPRRISQEEIRAAFGSGWRVESISPAKIELNPLEDGAHAWFATIETPLRLPRHVVAPTSGPGSASSRADAEHWAT